MKTIGENRVVIDFNVTNDLLVNVIKRKSAELINLAETMKHTQIENDIKRCVTNEKLRLIALAQTAYEEACMWLVKANFVD
jgi:hypothetical protein